MVFLVHGSTAYRSTPRICQVYDGIEPILSNFVLLSGLDIFRLPKEGGFMGEIDSLRVIRCEE